MSENYYPARPIDEQRAGLVRDGAHDTEIEAAESITALSGKQRMAVLALLRQAPDGLTDDELRARAAGLAIKMSRSGSSTRRSELVEAGYVAWSGQYRLTPFGRRAKVWQAAP